MYQEIFFFYEDYKKPTFAGHLTERRHNIKKEEIDEIDCSASISTQTNSKVGIYTNVANI